VDKYEKSFICKGIWDIFAVDKYVDNRQKKGG
jgi:hypothetical protein